jgi:hypothetical protein
LVSLRLRKHSGTASAPIVLPNPPSAACQRTALSASSTRILHRAVPTIGESLPVSSLHYPSISFQFSVVCLPLHCVQPHSQINAQRFTLGLTPCLMLGLSTSFNHQNRVLFSYIMVLVLVITPDRTNHPNQYPQDVDSCQARKLPGVRQRWGFTPCR